MLLVSKNEGAVLVSNSAVSAMFSLDFETQEIDQESQLFQRILFKADEFIPNEVFLESDVENQSKTFGHANGLDIGRLIQRGVSVNDLVQKDELMLDHTTFKFTFENPYKETTEKKLCITKRSILYLNQDCVLLIF